MTPPLPIRIGRACGEAIEALAPLVPIVAALVFVRALPWLLTEAML